GQPRDPGGVRVAGGVRGSRGAARGELQEIRSPPVTSTTPVLRSAMPCFLVPDVARTVAWYQKVLGFKNGSVWGEPGEAFGIASVGDGLGFHFKSAGDAMPALDPAPTVESAKLSAYLRLAGDRIRPLHDALVKAGVRVLGEPRH